VCVCEREKESVRASRVVINIIAGRYYRAPRARRLGRNGEFAREHNNIENDRSNRSARSNVRAAVKPLRRYRPAINGARLVGVG